MNRFSAENADAALEESSRCVECGWPGIGKMPTGVRTIRQNGKNLLIGQLFYYPMNGVMCSVCRDMESAVSGRPWFVSAHAEYQDQVEVKKRLLGGK